MPEEKDEKGRPAERERRHGEKDEKGRPAEHERHDEKGEKYRRDPFSAIFLGLIILMVAALWFLRGEGILVSGEWWQWVMIGVGSILIIDRLIRYPSPVHRRPMLGRIIIGIILIGIGIAFIYGVETWWPLILVVVAIAFIVYGIYRIRKPGA